MTSQNISVFGATPFAKLEMIATFVTIPAHQHAESVNRTPACGLRDSVTFRNTGRGR
jgi:hypothetical protein